VIKSRILIPYLLFLLFALYLLQGSLYPSGSFTSRTILFLILLISGSYIIIIIIRTKVRPPRFLIAWSLLLLLNVFGFLFTADFSNSYHFQMFKNILGAMLPIYPFYYYSRSNTLSDNDMKRFFFIIVPVTIVAFFSFKSQVLSPGNPKSGEVVNTMAYSFVYLIPFVFFFKRKRLFSALLIAIFMIFIIQGAKRGAIIAGTLGLVMFFILQLKTIKKQKPIKEYTAIIIITLILGILIYKTFVNNAFAIERISSLTEGRFSNRDSIYTGILSKWYNSENVLNFIFGYGFASSLKLTGGAFAHNDWLELISSFGIIGIAVYGYLFYSAIEEIRNNNREMNESILMITIIIIWGFTSLVSMWYTSFGVYNQAMLLGYLIGKRERLSIEEYQYA